MSRPCVTGISLVVAFSFVLLPWAAAAVKDGGPRKYALLVGVNEYDHDELSTLDWAVNDAAEMRDLLTGAGYEVILLTTPEAKAKKTASLRPTRANFETQLKTLVGKFAKGDTILIGLAGHGLQFQGDEDGYFCPVDARPYLGRTDTLVSIKWIYQRLKEDAASGVKLLLVDACRTLMGKRARGINGGNAPPPPDGIGVLLSCTAGQTARERDKYRHGVFFYHVLQGLKGKAADEEGSVTWDSLRAYVKKKVSRDEKEQAPEESGRLSGRPAVLVTVQDRPETRETETKVAKSEAHPVTGEPLAPNVREVPVAQQGNIVMYPDRSIPTVPQRSGVQPGGFGPGMDPFSGGRGHQGRPARRR